VALSPYQKVTGLDQRGLFFMLREVALLAKRISIAAGDLERSIPNDPDRAWYSIHNLVTTTGNLSKLLWPHPPKWMKEPDRQRHIRRGAALRAILAVPPSSVLQDRGSRDYLEHYDEWLTDWAANEGKGSAADLFVGPFEQFKNMPPADVHRHYDPETKTLHYQDRTYDLDEVLQAIRFIEDKAKVYAYQIANGSISAEMIQRAMEAKAREEVQQSLPT
jgi:hypothetical protein